MKQTKYGDSQVIAYQDDDLKSPDFQNIVIQGKSHWKDLCNEYVEDRINKGLNPDYGSCVLGAGLAVYYLAPKKRKPVHKMIISATEVSCMQGSCVWESCKDKVIEFLNKSGIESFYKPGWLD